MQALSPRFSLADAPDKTAEPVDAPASSPAVNAYTNPKPLIQDNMAPLLPPEQQPFIAPEGAPQFAMPAADPNAPPAPAFDSQAAQMPPVDPQAFPPAGAFQDIQGDTTSQPIPQDTAAPDNAYQR